MYGQDQEKIPDCRLTNLTYKTTCKLCMEEGRLATYTGETSRSLHERYNEHMVDITKREERSLKAKHMINIHPDH